MLKTKQSPIFFERSMIDCNQFFERFMLDCNQFGVTINFAYYYEANQIYSEYQIHLLLLIMS